jgi:hypothetical protein
MNNISNQINQINNLTRKLHPNVDISYNIRNKVAKNILVNYNFLKGIIKLNIKHNYE